VPITDCQGLNSAGSRRIPDAAPSSRDHAPLFVDPAPQLWDQLEFCSAMSLLVITHHDSYKHLKLSHFSVWLLSFWFNGKTWRCSQTRCRLYSYSPCNYRNFILEFYFLLNLGIRHLYLNTLTTKHYFSFLVSEMNETESNNFHSSALNNAV